MYVSSHWRRMIPNSEAEKVDNSLKMIWLWIYGWIVHNQAVFKYFLMAWNPFVRY